MRIVFGINSFKLKSLYPESYTYAGKTYEPVKVLGKTYESVEIEIRQKYFHLFWVPVIPVGKAYVLKHGDESLYLFNSLVQEKIKKETPRAPWYTFSAWLIGVLILIGINVNGLYGQYQRKKRIEERNQANIELIQNIKINDLYVMDYKKAISEDKRKYNSPHSISEKRFLVSKIMADSILFQELFYNKKTKKYEAHQEYFKNSDVTNFVWWYKPDLIKSCHDYMTLPFTNSNGLLKIGKIYDAKEREKMDSLQERTKRHPQYEEFMKLRNSKK